MAETIKQVGGTNGVHFEDVGFLGVKKVIVKTDGLRITYIKIYYQAKDNEIVSREHGTGGGDPKVYEPAGDIYAVGGSYKYIDQYETTFITSLYFETLKDKSPVFGEVSGNKFLLKGTYEGKLLGFHGLSASALNAIGAYFTTQGGLTGATSGP